MRVAKEDVEIKLQLPGVVVRLGKPFAKVERLDATTLVCGGGASGILVSSTARDNGIAGLEFLRSIPGTVGGFVRTNGGAYGREVSDVLIDCDVVHADGNLVTLPAAELHYSYRHSQLPEGAVVVGARFQGQPGDPAEIGAVADLPRELCIIASDETRPQQHAILARFAARNPMREALRPDLRRQRHRDEPGAEDTASQHAATIELEERARARLGGGRGCEKVAHDARLWPLHESTETLRAPIA